MSKKWTVILNILTVIAGLAFLVCLLDFVFSVKYKNREVEDPTETYAGVFEYELRHRAYGELMADYYARRLDTVTPQAGYEDLYKVAEYAHTAFMTRVYEEKGDAEKVSAYEEKKTALRSGLGAYTYTADEVDGMIEKAA